MFAVMTHEKDASQYCEKPRHTQLEQLSSNRLMQESLISAENLFQDSPQTPKSEDGQALAYASNLLMSSFTLLTILTIITNTMHKLCRSFLFFLIEGSMATVCTIYDTDKNF